MSHPLYEKYLSDMKRLKATPPYMTEAQVLESLGIKTEEEYVAPLQILPKKKVKDHPVQNDEVIAPKKPKAAQKPLTRKQKDKKNENRRQARSEARKKNPPKRISLEGMTDEEIRLHRNAQQRARMAKKRADGWTPPPKTPEQKKAQREYLKKYHQDRKNDPNYKSRRSLAQKRHYRRKANQAAETF